MPSYANTPHARKLVAVQEDYKRTEAAEQKVKMISQEQKTSRNAMHCTCAQPLQN